GSRSTAMQVVCPPANTRRCSRPRSPARQRRNRSVRRTWRNRLPPVTGAVRAAAPLPDGQAWPAPDGGRFAPYDPEAARTAVGPRSYQTPPTKRYVGSDADTASIDWLENLSPYRCRRQPSYARWFLVSLVKK